MQRGKRLSLSQPLVRPKAFPKTLRSQRRRNAFCRLNTGVVEHFEIENFIVAANTFASVQRAWPGEVVRRSAIFAKSQKPHHVTPLSVLLHTGQSDTRRLYDSLVIA